MSYRGTLNVISSSVSAPSHTPYKVAWIDNQSAWTRRCLMSYQEIKNLRRQAESHIDHAADHLLVDHSATAYCEYQNVVEILAERIISLEKETQYGYYLY